jgi:uncharacterized protein (TIGR02452 family)
MEPKAGDKPRRPDPELLKAQAEKIRHICASGSYELADGRMVNIRTQLDACHQGTRLIRPNDWPGVESAAEHRCGSAQAACPVILTGETTLTALRRLALIERRPSVSALNFASARNPGGGWDRGSVAQEESLARASGLVQSLESCPDYYQANRQQESLLYTDHAIWSPLVPIITNDEGAWEAEPYQAGIITMPAPNAGSMTREQDLLALIPTFRSRIRKVLALAVQVECRHLVLGAWGCGAFGNHPEIVAPLFADALDISLAPWRRGFDSITFAVYDSSRNHQVEGAFRKTFTTRGLI